MEIKENIGKALQELVLPVLGEIKQENAEIKVELKMVNKRLDDVNIHLADQSRRIDAVREELSGRIDSVEGKLTGKIESVREELTGKIESVREELTGRIDETNKRIDETNKHIESVKGDLIEQMKDLNNRVIGWLDNSNTRMDRLYEVVVKREEHNKLDARVRVLERDMGDLKRRLAA